MTPDGLCAVLPIVTLNSSYSIAMLPGCSFSRRELEGINETPPLSIWLPLRKSEDVSHRNKSALYTCLQCNKEYDRRVFAVPADLSSSLNRSWKEIYIIAKPAYRAERSRIPALIGWLNTGPPPPPFTFESLLRIKDPRIRLVGVTDPPIPWTGLSPVTLTFKLTAFDDGSGSIWRRTGVVTEFTVDLGRCVESVANTCHREKLACARTLDTKSDPLAPESRIRVGSAGTWSHPSTTGALSTPWIGPHYVVCSWVGSVLEPPDGTIAHNCATDHIQFAPHSASEQALSKSIILHSKSHPYGTSFDGLTWPSVKLSFMRSPLYPMGETLQLCVETEDVAEYVYRRHPC